MPSIVPVDHGNESKPNTTMPDDHARQEPDSPAPDNPEPDNPAPTSQPKSSSSRLESLPNELLIKIVNEAGNEERRRGWNAKSPVRSGYHALCLVSKRIELIARPYLFKTITIKDFRSAARLCRAIAGDPNLGHEISEIYLSVDFDQMTKRGPLPLTMDEEAKVLDDCYQIIGKYGSETLQRVERNGNGARDLIGMVCCELLSRAVNLRSLTVIIDHESHESDQGHSIFFNLVRGAVLSAADGAATVFLPRLENLTLWRCDGQFECELFGHFLGLPGLRTIHAVADDGNWPRLRNSSVGSTVAPLVCRNIVRLLLSISIACQDDIEDIVQSFPCLQVLWITSRDPQSRRLRFSVAAGGARVAGGLSIAFENMTALQELHIDIYAYAPFEHHFYDYVTTSLGPGPEKVLNLSQLPYLEKVEVPLLMFAHMGPSGFDGITAVPREVLPRPLRHLALLAHHECPYKDGTACWDSMERTLEFLESLGRDLSNFAQLRTVKYCYCENSCAHPIRIAARESQDDQPAEESPEDSPKASTRSRLQAIHTSFAEQNVQFSVIHTLFGGQRGMIDLREWKYYESGDLVCI